jgi:hypothetical protein
MVLGLATIGCCLFLNDDLTFTAPWGPLLKQAQAYIGNPLTPMSYAGVARRTARRAAWGNYYGSPYGYGPPYGAYGSPYGYGPPYGYRPPYGAYGSPYGYGPPYGF